MNLHGILIWFEAVSSLRVKLTKSSILPIGQVDNIDLLRGLLGWTTDSFPAANLVLPLGTKFKDKSIWEPIVERFERRLSKRLFEWKSKYLSNRGRLTLVKSIMSEYSSLLPITLSYIGIGGEKVGSYSEKVYLALLVVTSNILLDGILSRI